MNNKINENMENINNNIKKELIKAFDEYINKRYDLMTTEEEKTKASINKINFCDKLEKLALQQINLFCLNDAIEERQNELIKDYQEVEK